MEVIMGLILDELLEEAESEDMMSDTDTTTDLDDDPAVSELETEIDSDDGAGNNVTRCAPGNTLPEASKLVPTKEKVSEPLAACYSDNHEKSLDEDGQTCTICFEAWTNSSEHRLVSLRCGHLFGRSCITRWLKGQNSRCPQCNARARKSEIRNIYARTIKVLDTSERDTALKALEKESELRRSADIEAAQERLKCTMALQKYEMLKKELIDTQKMLKEARSGLRFSDNTSQSSKPKGPVFTLEKLVDISKIGGCRVMQICELLGTMLVSQPAISELFPGHGMKKVSLVDMKPMEFVWVHSKPIKDMAFHSHNGIVLTASLDKSVKLTNILTNSIVQTYTLEYDVWSCAWDTDNTVYFYAGLNNGSVSLFDIRVTNRHITSLPTTGPPVVALQYLQKARSARHSKCGPVAVRSSGCSFYEKPEIGNEHRVDSLPLIGNFTSVSAEPTTSHFLISSRPTKKCPRVTHTLCEFQGSGNYPFCNPVQTMSGGGTQLHLTRSKLLPHPDTESSLLVCAGDEDAHGALIWDGSNGTCLDNLRTESPVMDIDRLWTNHKSFLTTLTDKCLRLYSWTG